MKNLKYLEVRKDKLLYRRRVPRELASLFGKHTYYRQLQCKVGASDAEVVKAWAEAHESFEVMLQLSLTQFSDEVTEERLTRDAQHYLAFFKLSNGVLSELQKTYRIDPWDAEPVAFGRLQERDDLHRLYLHDHPNSPFDDFEQTHPPTLRQQIAQKAWEIAVSNTARVKPKRLISVSNRASRCMQVWPVSPISARNLSVFAGISRVLPSLNNGCHWPVMAR